MKRKLNRTWRVVMIVLVVLVAFRLSLPFILTRYVNRIIADLGPYSGQVKDVNVHMLRAAYDLVELTVSDTSTIQKTSFHAPLVELSVEWAALLEGKFAGEAIFVKPTLNFYAAYADADSIRQQTRTPLGIAWQPVLQKLLPVPLNHLQVNAGKINFTDANSSPTVELTLSSVQVDAQNLQNVKGSNEALPSRIYLQALSSGNGQLNIAAKANVQNEVPAMDMDVRFEKVNLKGLQSLFKAYGDAVIEDGDFSLFAEIVVENAQITGYVKPFFKNVTIVRNGVSEGSPNDHAIHNLIARISEVLNTKFPDRIIARVPMKAQLPNGKSQFWPAVWSTFSNAFTNSFGESSGNTVALAASPPPPSESVSVDDQPKSKKELRREKRKERREERRKLKLEKNNPGENENADAEQKKKDNSR